MLSPFSCVFSHPETSEEFDEPIITNSPCSTPRRSNRRSTNLIHRIHNNNNKDSKNPYSNRGLDKFSALMADLEEKRQKIYAQTGSQDGTFVRFVYKDSNDSVPVPIVLKLKDNKKQEAEQKTKSREEKHVPLSSENLNKLTDAEEVVNERTKTKKNSETTEKSMFELMWNINFRRPSFYLPVVVVLILVLLAIVGRSGAILCTSIGWYAIPTLKEQNASSPRRRRASKHKEQVKKSSTPAEGLASPKGDNNTAAVTPRSQQHGHRKSW